jgi:hypothetical protein
MDPAVTALFRTVKAQRGIIRELVLLEGMTVAWAIAIARDARQKLAAGKQPGVGPSKTDAAYANYAERLPALAKSLETGEVDLGSAWINAVRSGDRTDFLDRRRSMIQLIEQLQISDALVGKYTRVDRRKFVERASCFRLGTGAESGDVSSFETECRMTLDQFFVNSDKITAAASGRDAARRQIVPYYDKWATDVAERLYPGKENARADARVGLMRATAYFDCEQSYKFETYATWWLQKAMSVGFQPLPAVR